MGGIDDFINSFFNTQSNPLVSRNDSEFNGNSNDLLFTTDQSAQALSVSGGTSLTSLNPQNFINDLTSGKLTPVVWIWLAIIAIGGYWLLKKK